MSRSEQKVENINDCEQQWEMNRPITTPVCFLCLQKFEREEQLKLHKEQLCDERKISCPDCNEACVARELSSHLSVQCRQRQAKCTVPDCTFVTSVDKLAAHEQDKDVHIQLFREAAKTLAQQVVSLRSSLEEARSNCSKACLRETQLLEKLQQLQPKHKGPPPPFQSRQKMQKYLDSCSASDSSSEEDECRYADRMENTCLFRSKPSCPALRRQEVERRAGKQFMKIGKSFEHLAHLMS
jgi:hypothetical protein